MLAGIFSRVCELLSMFLEASDKWIMIATQLWMHTKIYEQCKYKVLPNLSSDFPKSFVKLVTSTLSIYDYYWCGKLELVKDMWKCG